MKKIFFFTLFLFAALFFSQSVKAQTEAQKVELCTKAAGGATLLNSFPVQLPAANDGQRAPVFRTTLAMRKGNCYRFTICTDEESAGEAIMQVYEEGKLLLSTYLPETGKMYPYVDLECNKMSKYTIMISFKDGREGSAVGIVSHVRTL